MNTIQIKQGDVKSAILAVSSLLVSDHKFSKSKAAEKATAIVKKAKAKNANFDGAFITSFTEDELKTSVGKVTAVKKEPKEKPGLTAGQLKIAGNEKLTLNERARMLLTETNFTQITAIANALGVSFQRVTNVRKNMQKGKADKLAKAAPAKSATAMAKSAAGKTVPAGSGKKAATADEPRQKRKYTRRAK